MKHLKKVVTDTHKWFMCDSKHGYTSLSTANLAKKRRKKKFLRAYHCPYCDLWHLTKSPKRP